MQALDNIIWKSLTTRHVEFAQGVGHARRFIPEVSPLAALREPTAQGYTSLAELLPAGGTIGLFLDEPYQAGCGWKYVAGAPLVRMVCENRHSRTEPCCEAVIELGDADSPEMIQLTTLTKPGPFGKRTHELGTYLGIRREGRLVAMAGERLKVPGFTEISAVCTHPDHTGKGYARVLMTALMQRIHARGEMPCLHVRQDNVHAIGLYERLGFRQCHQGHYAVLRKIAS